MNIGILTGCDSDRHLSENIFMKLNELYNIYPTYIHLVQNDIIGSFEKAKDRFEEIDYSFVLAVGDRPEQVGGVLAAFHNKIPIGHLYAGDLNTIATFDDKNRHIITLYSDIQFCSCKESKENTERLMRSVGLVPNANIVGATHFDGKQIIKDFNEIMRKKPYILILINSETIGNDKKLVEEVATKVISLNTSDSIIIAKGNNDNDQIEYNLMLSINEKDKISQINIVHENRKNHEYFLSLIKNSDYFITNSSSVIYEAPALLERGRIIHIENRNKDRTKIPLSSHDGRASHRVSRLIKTFLEAKQ